MWKHTKKKSAEKFLYILFPYIKKYKKLWNLMLNKLQQLIKINQAIKIVQTKKGIIPKKESRDSLAQPLHFCTIFIFSYWNEQEYLCDFLFQQSEESEISCFASYVHFYVHFSSNKFEKVQKWTYIIILNNGKASNG